METMKKMGKMKEIKEETNKRIYERPQMELLWFTPKENLALSGPKDPDGSGWSPWV